MHLIFAVLVPLTIVISWLRLVGIGGRQTEGTRIETLRMPLLARIYMHAVPVAISVIVTIVAIAIRAVPWWMFGAPVISGAILIALPLRYTLTDAGMRRTFGLFRRWTEFAGVERARGGARLKPVRTVAPARIWLSGSRGDDEFLQLLRTLIRNAYQGRPAASDDVDRRDQDHTPGQPTVA